MSQSKRALELFVQNRNKDFHIFRFLAQIEKAHRKPALLLWLTPSVIRTLHYCLSSIQSQLRLMFSLQETKICLWTTLHLFMYATIQKGTSVLSFILKFIKIYNCHVTPFFITKNYFRFMCTKLNDILFNVKVFCSNFKTFLCIYVFLRSKSKQGS